MADYQPLIAKAVAALERNTGETRRVLYERARKALVSQLRNMTPPLTESEITRERLALEEAIRKVEAEATRRARSEPPRPEPAAKPVESEAPEGAKRAAAGNRDRPAPAPTSRDAQDGAGSADSRPVPERPNLAETGLKGFRDVVAEAETLGEKTVQAAKSARAVYAAVPTHVPELDRVEPHLEPEGLRSSPSEPPPPPLPEDLPRFGEARLVPPPPPPMRSREGRERPKLPSRSRKGLIAALLTLLVIFALAAGAVWQREQIAAFFGAVRGLAPQFHREAAPARPKIPDRIAQEGEQEPPRIAPGREGPDAGPPMAAVAQRVVLYEEDPADPAGKRYVGSAIWRTETVSPGPGLSPELAIRCDVAVPERRLAMTMSIRRNTDQALPASHTIEVLFNLPADFPFGGINNVPGILMKQAEQTRGAPLSGLAVKVTSGFFLVGLSAVETEAQRNIELLKERTWFDIPVVYNNGRRAILAIEKGNPGERVFAEAFKAWGQ